MQLGMFMMPVHHPAKPWGLALSEDREAVIRADRLGFAEVWIGEHFTSRPEQIPSPMMFLASVIGEARNIRFGTGVINLPHHNPIVVAAEAAMFDHLCGGRLMLGIGPGGLFSDAELFGHDDMGERYRMAMESLDIILKLWHSEAPLRIDGEFWKISLETNVWPYGGIGSLSRPLQEPHPPIAMAVSGPGGRTAEIIAERDCIPISANMVPIETVAAQWTAYAAARDKLNKPADRGIWRVCRNILVTESEQQAHDALSNPDATLPFYFRYLRGLRRIPELRSQLGDDAGPTELDAFLDVAQAIEDCAIVGTSRQVLDRLVAIVDHVGPFGRLIMVGHDWEETGLWQASMGRLAREVMPKLSQHASALAG
jgi:alkanesulfonate monooxygenase SsuD/methylene tetrahydromethanopterin reductase-like flavin-dependent oxidoreductase (luciferase family)